MAKKEFFRTDEEDGSDILQRVPLKERPIVAKLGVEERENKHLPDNLSEEAFLAIKWLRANAKHFRLYSEPLPRLAFGRQKIIEEVARNWGVSPRMVRSIWETGQDD